MTAMQPPTLSDLYFVQRAMTGPAVTLDGWETVRAFTDRDAAERQCRAFETGRRVIADRDGGRDVSAETVTVARVVTWEEIEDEGLVAAMVAIDGTRRQLVEILGLS